MGDGYETASAGFGYRSEGIASFVVFAKVHGYKYSSFYSFDELLGSFHVIFSHSAVYGKHYQVDGRNCCLKIFYFRQRPYKSRIGARISPQSRPLKSRMQLIRNFVAEAARWVGREVERPAHWGGYAVTPHRIEFWQGRANRLHDRFLYSLQPDGSWQKERLAP